MREIAGVWLADDDELTHYIEHVQGWYYPCCGGPALLQLVVGDIKEHEIATCLLCIVELLTCP